MTQNSFSYISKLYQDRYCVILKIHLNWIKIQSSSWIIVERKSCCNPCNRHSHWLILFLEHYTYMKNYLSISHLHFSIFQPNGNISVIHIKSPFPYRPCPLYLFLWFLPLCIFDPVWYDCSIFSNIIFKLFSSSQLIIGKLSWIRNFLFRGRWKYFKISFFCFSQ